jgi:hypothetical protein
MVLKDFYYPSRGRASVVSVTKSGTITISKSLVEKHQLNKYSYAKLRHDDVDAIMVLQLLVERTPGVVSIKNGPSLVIPAKCFVEFLRIRPGEYEAEWDETDGTLSCIYTVADANAA